MNAISLFVMKAPIILSTIFLTLCTGGVAKTHAQGYQAGFYFTAMSPSGEFNDNVTNNGTGFGVLFLKRIGPSPILVGVDAGFVIYGFQDGLERLSITNNVYLAHFLTRVQPRKGKVRPYAEGLIGLKNLSTIDEPAQPPDYAVIEGKTYLSDTGLSYGVGGGLQIPLTRNVESRVMLDGNVRYLRGGRARYLKEGSIREVDGVFVFDPLTSRTDVITIQIGITFRF
jgi:opacity protein-like surface antigen